MSSTEAGGRDVSTTTKRWQKGDQLLALWDTICRLGVVQLLPNLSGTYAVKTSVS